MNETDLERYVADKQRAELVKKVRSKINELNIQYIYYQFISVTGRIVGKGIPADHWEKRHLKGFQLVYGSTANLFIDRHDQYIGYGPEAMELVGILIGIPSANTLGQKSGWGILRMFLEIEKSVKIQAHFLPQIVEKPQKSPLWVQKSTEWNYELGRNQEMMWLKRGEDGKPNGGVTEPYYYHIDQFEDLRPYL